MPLDIDAVHEHVREFTVPRWVRVMAAEHASTPLGVGFGSSRFSSPSKSFKVMYLGVNPITAICETVVRDRFEAASPDQRKLLLSEIAGWSVCEVSSAVREIRVLDLTGLGAVSLGLNTDACGARAHQEGQAFSEELHALDEKLDGILYRSRISQDPCLAIYDRAIAGRFQATRPIGLHRLRSLRKDLRKIRVGLRNDLKKS